MQHLIFRGKCPNPTSSPQNYPQVLWVSAESQSISVFILSEYKKRCLKCLSEKRVWREDLIFDLC